MKALHVKTFRCEGVMDFIHGGGGYVDGIFMPEEKLMIQYEGKTADVIEGALDDFISSSPGGGPELLKPKIIKEIEVPESIVAAARTLISTRETFTQAVGEIWKSSVR